MSVAFLKRQSSRTQREELSTKGQPEGACGPMEHLYLNSNDMTVYICHNSQKYPTKGVYFTTGKSRESTSHSCVTRGVKRGFETPSPCSGFPYNSHSFFLFLVVTRRAECGFPSGFCGWGTADPMPWFLPSYHGRAQAVAFLPLHPVPSP